MQPGRQLIAGPVERESPSSVAGQAGRASLAGWLLAWLE